MRRRLLKLLLVPLAVVLVIGTTAEILSAEKPINDAYDQAMADAALAMALNVDIARDGRIDLHMTQETLNLLKTDTADAVYYQVRAPDGSLLAGDSDLPVVADAGENPAYGTSAFRGKPVRLMTYRSSSQIGTVPITIAETLNKRHHVRAQIWSTALWANALELLIILVCVWFMVSVALQPLELMGEQISSRSPQDLTPLPLAGVPLELRAVIGKLNSLLATIAASSRAERDFLDNAAHQLRTPLTGLLAQLDLMIADEPDAGRNAQLCVLRGAAQRLVRTTQQLLALAKSEHREHTFSAREAVDLAPLAATAVSGFVQRASAAGIDLGAELAAARIAGVAWLLAEALDNLIDNALIYTPAGGMVTVRTGTIGQAAFLEVADTGAGIPQAERQQVLSRFYRGSASRGAGSGLGLTIVAEVAQLHGATVTIAAGDHERGTRVRLDFPAHPL